LISFALILVLLPAFWLKVSVHRKMRPLKYNLDMATVAFRNG
jgi:hypothetical protein